VTTYRIPFGVVCLPEGDYMELDSRVDRRPAGRERTGGHTRISRARIASAVSVR
jgi:hypothetical protein